MNEDDTFRKLRQVPIDQMPAIVNGMPSELFDEITDDEEALNEFLRPYGWTLEEILDEAERKDRADKENKNG